jgi:3-oxoacyl-[acyl-carrier protein] reductase
MSGLAEKVALVTGGSRGIGAAIAKRLAADGATVAITYAKDAKAASEVVAAIVRDGGNALAIQADAADVVAVKNAVEKTVTAFKRLDVLVNNAGTAIPKPFEETTLEEMARVTDINFRGAMVATQAALKHMKSGGHIIMIGSAVGERSTQARESCPRRGSSILKRQGAPRHSIGFHANPELPRRIRPDAANARIVRRTSSSANSPAG